MHVLTIEIDIDIWRITFLTANRKYGGISTTHVYSISNFGSLYECNF